MMSNENSFTIHDNDSNTDDSEYDSNSDDSEHDSTDETDDELINNDQYDPKEIYIDEDELIGDCGPCVFKYTCQQAIEDGTCKPIQPTVALYAVFPKHESRYQPLMETIIRTVLSNTDYDYFNILTYHSFVNPHSNEAISVVMDFASAQNQRLISSLFNRIKQEEYPESHYQVEDLILKGVAGTTPNKQTIINTFNTTVKGRIMILASCGILNEGIDTNTANMAIPIHPSKSIVKESQRIGRIMRKSPTMAPSILLIPCLVNHERYQNMDTVDEQSTMIREQMHPNGDFKVLLNVISALKHQYDDDMFRALLTIPKSALTIGTETES